LIRVDPRKSVEKKFAGGTLGRRSVQILVVAVLLAGAFFLELPGLVDQEENKVLKRPPYAASARALELHRQLTIADLHADSLLWGRDLLERGTEGHVDIPRMVEGNVALQIFSLPTRSPHGLNIESNEDRNDDITLLAIVDRWPVRTWRSLTERALYHAGRLHQMSQASRGTFVVIENAADLSAYLERRRQNRNLAAGMLSIEGAHALDGKLENLEVLYRAGYRMISPSHFFDNDIGGSAAGVAKTGITDKGREWVRQMEARHMIIDLAHASAKTIDDVLALSTRPLVVSHTGVKGTCNNNRNLSDEQIRAIAAKGGLIGIGYWDTATCGTDAGAIVNAMRYVSERVGAQHVALGSDFDGAVTTPFDTTGLAQITDAMLAAGYTEQQIRLIMGENVTSFLRDNLPEK
jgi:membrane dipeptidase